MFNICFHKCASIVLQVFLYQGRVHIVPLPETPDEATFLPHTVPSVQEALICIHEHTSTTTADDKIQQDITQRISG